MEGGHTCGLGAPESFGGESGGGQPGSGGGVEIVREFEPAAHPRSPRFGEFGPVRRLAPDDELSALGGPVGGDVNVAQEPLGGVGVLEGLAKGGSHVVLDAGRSMVDDRGEQYVAVAEVI